MRIIDNTAKFIQNHPTIKNILTLPKDGAQSAYLLTKSYCYDALKFGAIALRSEQKRKYYRARSTQVTSDIQAIWNKRHYGDRLIFPTNNIAKREVMKDKQDLKESQDILTDIKTIQQLRKGTSGKQMAFDNVRVEKDPEHCITDGICFGICLYAANRFLDGKDVDDLKKGAPVEAAANQAVYHTLISDQKFRDFVVDIVEKIKFSGGYDNIDLDGVLFAFASKIGLDPKLKLLFKEAARTLLDDNPYYTESKRLPLKYRSLYRDDQTLHGDLSEQETSLYNALLQYSQGLLSKSIEDHKRSESEPPPSKNPFWRALKETAISLFGKPLVAEAQEHIIEPIKKKAINLFGKPKIEDTKELVFEPIEDPLMQYQVRQSYQHMIDKRKCEVMVNYRNCRYQELNNVFGMPGTYPNDEGMLSNLNQLGQGVYYIHLETKKTGHSLLLKKDRDGSAVLLDPNIGILRCQNEQETYDLLKEVVSRYPHPENTHPHKKKGDVNHQLRFLKIEKN